MIDLLLHSARQWHDAHRHAQQIVLADFAVRQLGLPTAAALTRLRYTEIGMPRKTEGAKSGRDELRLPAGVVLKPPVSIEDLTTGIEYDPAGAEEFVALIRALRTEGSRPVSL